MGVVKMTKDEMKNRISMALKDPILQQGFEIICKENAELRKFRELLAVGSKLNKGLISRNKFLEKERDKYRNMVFNKMEQHEDEVKLLKKENAKLKKEVLEVGQHLESTEMEWGKDTAKFIYYKTQLTKAKKLLAKWVELFKPKSNIALPIPIQVDTEQFLKEVENEEMAERYVKGIIVVIHVGKSLKHKINMEE